MNVRCMITCAALSFACSCTVAGSETPPAGPPWRQDFSDAQRAALSGGKPMFLYFTKTY